MSKELEYVKENFEYHNSKDQWLGFIPDGDEINVVIYKDNIFTLNNNEILSFNVVKLLFLQNQQSLTPQPNTEVEKLLNEVKGLYISLATSPNQIKKCRDLSDNLRLHLQSIPPRVTQEEIVKRWHSYLVNNQLLKELKYEDGKFNVYDLSDYSEVIISISKNNLKDLWKLPLEFINLITIFFTQEVESDG